MDIDDFDVVAYDDYEKLTEVYTAARMIAGHLRQFNARNRREVMALVLALFPLLRNSMTNLK